MPRCQEEFAPLVACPLQSAKCEPSDSEEDNLPIPLVIRRLTAADLDNGWEET